MQGFNHCVCSIVFAVHSEHNKMLVVCLELTLNKLFEDRITVVYIIKVIPQNLDFMTILNDYN